MTIRRTTVRTVTGEVRKIDLCYEPEPWHCDHHWEWIGDHILQCRKCRTINSRHLPVSA